MKTNLLRNTLTVVAALASCGVAQAHLNYTNRDFGSWDPGNEYRTMTLSGSVSGDFGWAFGTEDALADSHRMRAFRFHLANAGFVNIMVGSTGAGTFFPAYSIYEGLSHLRPNGFAHDQSERTQQALTAIYGDPHGKRGAFNSLGDWVIGNDDRVDPEEGFQASSLRWFTYAGHAADGSSANFGLNPAILGDGLADGFVSGDFYLEAGDYTLMVGGAFLRESDPGGPYTAFPVNTTITVIPEPSAATLALVSCLGLLLARRRRV